MHLKELISLKCIHNVSIVIHPTAEFSVVLLIPDVILQGKLACTDLGSAFDSNSWRTAVLIQLCNLLLNQALRVSRGND